MSSSLMFQGEFVQLQQEGALATLTLNRPAKANAYHAAMLDELFTAVQCIQQDERINCTVLTSATHIFCAGADLGEIKQRSSLSILHLKSRRVFEAIQQLPSITIAQVPGHAVAGGFELMMSCDFVFAQQQAKFWLPEIELGLIPAASGIQSLLQRAGLALTKELVMTGRAIGADEALQRGLINQVYDSHEVLIHETRAFAQNIAQKSGAALRVAKMSIHHPGPASDLLGQAFLNEVKASQEE